MNIAQPSPVALRSPGILSVYRRSPRCTVLGPGVRAVIWVQGCPLRCPGCVAPETLPFEGGEKWLISQLVDEYVELPEIEGVTFSGGEPMSQAAALSELIDRTRRQRDLTFVSYTGFLYEDLLRHGSAAQRGLLERLDLLIDGPYIASRHTDLKWRGSDNQRVHFLSERYRDLEPTVDERGNWIEFELPADGSVQWMGIPPQGFRDAFRDGLSQLGIDLIQIEESGS